MILKAWNLGGHTCSGPSLQLPLWLTVPPALLSRLLLTATPAREVSFIAMHGIINLHLVTKHPLSHQHIHAIASTSPSIFTTSRECPLVAVGAP